MANIILQIILLLSLCGIYFSNGITNHMDKTLMAGLLLINAISLVSFAFLRKEKIAYMKKHYLKVSNLFLFGFIIAHFQAYLDFLLGNLEIDNTYIWIDNVIVVKSFVLCSLAFVSFLLSYSLFNNKALVIKEVKKFRVLKISFLNFLAFVFLAAFFLTVNRSYLQGNYGTESRGNIASIGAFLFECVVYSIVIINARNLLIQGRTKIKFTEYLLEIKYTVAMLGLYLLSVMLSGDRGPIIFSSLIVVFGFIYLTKKRISIVKLFLFLIVSSSVITLLGAVRKMDNNLSFSENIFLAYNSDLEDRYYPSSVSNSTKELASSIRTVHLAVSVVPSKYNHFNGAFAFMDLLLIVPSANSSFVSVFGFGKETTNSAEFLTFVDMGSFASWGVGTSCVADTYLDFGFFGIIIVFFLFGAALRRMEVVTFSNNIGSLLLIICAFLFFSYSIYIPRATILYALSRVLYILGFCLLPVILVKKKKLRSN